MGDSKKLKIISITADANIENTLLWQSLKHVDTRDIAVDIIVNDDCRSLPELYNESLNNHTGEDYVVFCHDDISIEDTQLMSKLDTAIGSDSQYAICGLAGNTACAIKDKNLWHWMGTKTSLSGAVAHYTGNGEDECFVTNFGNTPTRVILLDGVFMAMNVSKINKVGLRYDEQLPSKFHFYDLDISLQSNKLGLKMTTCPIWIRHRSHGLHDINHTEWNAGNTYFKNKWSDN